MVMETSKDIHNYAGITAKYIENITNSEIDKSNKADLLRYAKAMQDLSPGTQSKNLQVVFRFTKFLPMTFKKATAKDIDKVLDQILNPSQTVWTRSKYKSCIKKFYKWIYGMVDDYPKQVKHIRARKQQTRGVPLDRLSIEDYAKLIQAAENPRDRFIIAYYADTGARASELGSQNIENVIDKGKHIISQITESKTQPRSLPLRNSMPYLLDWLAVHPNPQHGQPLLVDKGKRMSYDKILEVPKKAKEKTDIKKPCNLQHIRRSTATIYGQFFHENEMDTWFGWGKQKMSNVYVQFSGKQLLEAYDKFWNSDKNILKRIICPSCKEENVGVRQYCIKCKEALLNKTALNNIAKDEEIAISKMREEIISNLMNNPKIKKEIFESVTAKMELDKMVAVLNAKK